MADTTPLRSIRATRPLEDVETNDLKEHYRIAAAGFYSEKQYADISLLRRQQN